MSKHYQNDIKKQLGIDQTRTKSEKQLDNFAAKRNTMSLADSSIMPVSQPTKKLKKQNNQSNDPLAVSQKLLKTICGSSTQISKKIKAIAILRKCFTDITFTEAIANSQSELLEMMIQLYELSHQDEIMLITINENRTLMDNIGQIWCDIQKLIKTNKLLEEKLKCQLFITLEKNYCRLFVDDSFSFIKSFNNLKESLNAIFQEKVKQQSGKNELQKQQKQETKGLPGIIQQSLKILTSLFKIPFPIQLETVKISVISFLKHFVINYLKILIKDETQQKRFLSSYNAFISKKKIGNDSGTSSLDIMNNKGKQQGLKIGISYGGGADAWIQKQ